MKQRDKERYRIYDQNARNQKSKTFYDSREWQLTRSDILSACGIDVYVYMTEALELLWHYGFHNRRCGQACSGWIRLDGWRMYRNQEKKCRDIADKYAWSNSEAVYCIYV